MTSKFFSKVLESNAGITGFLLRLMVGPVFLSEGIQKFLRPDKIGAGRFEKMGFPDPETWATLVASFEIGCGFLLLVGFLTRFAAVPIFVIMAVAIATTKIPILLGRDLGIFQVRSLDAYGFWSMAHEMRTDWAMLLGSLVLILIGAGKWSVDRRLSRTSDSG
ncbi:MAG: DoxX family protein [Verrucomicrobiales bacterium]